MDPKAAQVTVGLPALEEHEVGSVVTVVNITSDTNGFKVEARDGDAAINAGTSTTNTTAWGSVCLKAVSRTLWVVLWST